MIEISRETEAQGVRFRSIIDKGDFDLYRDVGAMHPLAKRVNVRIVAEEGQQYTHESTDFESRRRMTYTGLVPEGKVYVEVSSVSNDIGYFWRDLEMNKKFQSPSSQE